jgi:hypothetical protein
MPAPPKDATGSIRDSREISTDTLLTELAAKAEAERAARAEAEELRRQLRALDESARRLPKVELATSNPPKRADWLKLVYALGGALTLFLGGLGTYLGARASANGDKVDRVAAATSAQKIVVDPLPKQVAQVERGADGCREWARLYSDYDRQIFRKMGIIIPEPENAKPVDPISTRAPMRKPNTVSGALVLEVLTPPPPLP